MEDVIKRAGNTFGTNETIILSQLSAAAAPAAAIIFLDIVTNKIPAVCVIDGSDCELYKGSPTDLCTLNTSLWDYVDVESSIVASFDLLCHPSWHITITRLLFFFGMLIGCSFAGIVSDWVGRKPALMTFMFGEGVFTVLLIVASNYGVWLFLRLMTGVCIGYFVVSKVLIIEALKIQYRNCFLTAIWCSFGAGLLFLGLLDFLFVRYDDKIACLVILISLLWALYLFGIEESLRWLLVKRKKEQATYLLGKIAFRNKVTLPSYEDIPIPRDDEYNILDIFRLSKSRYLIAILVVLSILSFFLLVFYSYSFSNESVGNFSVALNLVILGILHVVGVGVSAVSCYYWGRRPTASSLHIVVFVLLVVLTVLMNNVIYVVTAAWCIRCISAGMVYFCSLYSLEVFATPFRAKAVGLVASGGAAGGIMASVLDIFSEGSYELTFIFVIIQAIFVFIVTILTFSLRETKGRPLPERLDTMPQILPLQQWCQCSGDNPENNPLLDSPLFSHIYPYNSTTLPSSTGRTFNMDKISESTSSSRTIRHKGFRGVLRRSNSV